MCSQTLHIHAQRNARSSDTPPGLKPNGFCPRGFSLWIENCIPLTLRASYAERIAPLRGRCHHLRLLGRDPDTFAYVVLPFDTHAAIKTVLFGVGDSLVYPQWLRTRECFYAAPFVLQPLHSLVVQSTTSVFFSRREKVERRGFKPGTPNRRDSSPVACGGLKPQTVSRGTTSTLNCIEEDVQTAQGNMPITYIQGSVQVKS